MSALSFWRSCPSIAFVRIPIVVYTRICESELREPADWTPKAGMALWKRVCVGSRGGQGEGECRG